MTRKRTTPIFIIITRRRKFIFILSIRAFFQSILYIITCCGRQGERETGSKTGDGSGDRGRFCVSPSLYLHVIIKKQTEHPSETADPLSQDALLLRTQKIPRREK
jgi:hypothetical protein